MLSEILIHPSAVNNCKEYKIDVKQFELIKFLNNENCVGCDWIKSFSKPIFPFGKCPYCNTNTYICFSKQTVYCMNCDYDKSINEHFSYDRHELIMLLNNNIRNNNKYD